MTTPNNKANAGLAALSGLIGTIIIWIITAVLGYTIKVPAAAAIITVVNVTVLYVGRRGFKGLFRTLWRGEGNGNNNAKS